MKPFNLEEYLANPSKKIVTKDGRKVKRVLCTDAMGPYPIVVLIEQNNNTEDIAIQYTKDGRYFNEGTSNKDLFFATEKHERWVNVYLKSNGDLNFGKTYSFEKEAKDGIGSHATYITTVKVEWEE